MGGDDITGRYYVTGRTFLLWMRPARWWRWYSKQSGRRTVERASEGGQLCLTCKSTTRSRSITRMAGFVAFSGQVLHITGQVVVATFCIATLELEHRLLSISAGPHTRRVNAQHLLAIIFFGHVWHNNCVLCCVAVFYVPLPQSGGSSAPLQIPWAFALYTKQTTKATKVDIMLLRIFLFSSSRRGRVCTFFSSRMFVSFVLLAVFFWSSVDV